MLRRPSVLLLLLVGCLFHPVQAAEVQLSTPTGALFGTLLTTPGDGPMDVVILHAGSGPTDRDGNNPKMRNDSLKLLAEVPPPLAMLYRPSVQPYMISWLRYDPAALLADLRLPVLIVGGSTDLQVGGTDFRALAAARPDPTAVMLDGMNHVLKTAPADRAANIAAYGDPSRPLHPGLMPVLTGFLEKLPPV